MPKNLGFLFSQKADIPSFVSYDSKSFANLLRSSFKPDTISLSKLYFTNANVDLIARGEFFDILIANSSTAGINLDNG